MNWISNEKDVQQYFEALVSKMTKEFETEKQPGQGTCSKLTEKCLNTNLSSGSKLKDSETTRRELLDDMEILNKTRDKFRINTELKILDFCDSIFNYFNTASPALI
eukprot:bmy_17504T0